MTRPRRRSSPTAPTVLSSVVSSQVDLHARFGGVVPEIASRAHVRAADAGRGRGARRGGGRRTATSTRWRPPSGPGWWGRCSSGSARPRPWRWCGTCRSSASTTSRPTSTHRSSRSPTSSHRWSCCSSPAGTRMLVAMEGHGRYRQLGTTVDDAAGEAFDKVARFLGLGYPGGPAIDRVAHRGRPRGHRFPRAMLDRRLRLLLQRAEDRGRQLRAQAPRGRHGRRGRLLPAGGGRRAGGQGPPGRRASGRPRPVLAGGVAANSLLRERMLDACVEDGLRAFLPSRSMCTDNAAMVAAAAWWRLRSDGPTALDAGADPNLRLV